MTKIAEFIEQANTLYDLSTSAPKFKAWKHDVTRYIKKRYGESSTESVAFEEIRYFYMTLDYTCDHTLEDKKCFKEGLDTAVLYLQRYEADKYISFIGGLIFLKRAYRQILLIVTLAPLIIVAIKSGVHSFEEVAMWITILGVPFAIYSFLPKTQKPHTGDK